MKLQLMHEIYLSKCNVKNNLKLYSFIVLGKLFFSRQTFIAEKTAQEMKKQMG